MELQKLNVKFFAELPNTVPLADFIEIFHGWIQATDGIYHDVADYSHMQAGPGIVLVANDANVSVDETENRRGLLFSFSARAISSRCSPKRWISTSARITGFFARRIISSASVNAARNAAGSLRS